MVSKVKSIANSSFGIIYPKKLEDIIKENHYIPRLLRNYEKFKLYHRYWDIYKEELFKIIDIFEIDGATYYSICIDDTYSSIIPEPEHIDTYYEILKDYYCIAETYIINDNNYYTGAEIKYWFSINNIPKDDVYKGFFKYFSINSRVYLYDSKKYKVKYNPENKYSPCNIIKENKSRG